MGVSPTFLWRRRGVTHCSASHEGCWGWLWGTHRLLLPQVQIDPYLEDSMCQVCSTQPGPFFCRDQVRLRPAAVLRGGLGAEEPGCPSALPLDLLQVLLPLVLALAALHGAPAAPPPADAQPEEPGLQLKEEAAGRSESFR